MKFSADFSASFGIGTSGVSASGRLSLGGAAGLSAGTSAGGGFAIGPKNIAAIGKRKDPYLSFRFGVEIGGLIVGGFSEVTGLQVETETEDYQEGGVNDFVHKLPKTSRHQNLVLKRGLTDSDILWNWHQNTLNGKIDRKNGSIVLIDIEGNETWRWEFADAYPVKWTGPDLRADSDGVAVETLELAHNGVRKG